MADPKITALRALIAGRPRASKIERCRMDIDARGRQFTIPAADNRRFVDAVLYRYRTGTPWRDLPDDLGGWNNTHRRIQPPGQTRCVGQHSCLVGG